MPTSDARKLLEWRIEEAERLTARTNKAAVLVIQQFPVPEDAELLFPPVRESIANVMAFVELGHVSDVEWVLERCGASFTRIAVDCDHKLPESAEIVNAARRLVTPARLMLYSDNQAWFDSALDMIQRVESGVPGRSILVCGSGYIAEQMRFTLPRLGARLLDAPQPVVDGAPPIVIGVSQKAVSIDDQLIERLPDTATVYDLGIGNLTARAAECARARGLRVYRLDNRAGLSTVIVRLLETDYMVTRLMGRVTVRDVEIVAGGLLASPGAVIVDDIRNPSVVFGVADGEGRFRRPPLSPEDQQRMDFVRSLIVRAPTGDQAPS